MNRSDLVTVVGLGVVAGVTVAVMMLSNGCGNSEAKSAVDDAAHHAELIRCREMAKSQPEGTQFRWFCECRSQVNAKYSVDGGPCER